MAENGSAAEAASVSPKQLWNTARNGVMQQVALSQAFDTLRDMSSNTFIDPSQLDTISVLGQGGYAKVEKAWCGVDGQSVWCCMLALSKALLLDFTGIEQPLQPLDQVHMLSVT